MFQDVSSCLIQGEVLVRIEIGQGVETSSQEVHLESMGKL